LPLNQCLARSKRISDLSVADDRGAQTVDDFLTQGRGLEHHRFLSEPEHPANDLCRSANVHAHLDGAIDAAELLGRMPLPGLDVSSHLRVEKNPDMRRLSADKTERPLRELLRPEVRRVLETLALQPLDLRNPSSANVRTSPPCPLLRPARYSPFL